MLIPIAIAGRYTRQVTNKPLTNMRTQNPTLIDFISANAICLSEVDLFTIAEYLANAAKCYIDGTEFTSLSNYMANRGYEFGLMDYIKEIFFVSNFETIMGTPDDRDLLFPIEMKQTIKFLMS